MSHLSPKLALLMTLPPLLWAGNAVVGRLMVGSVPPIALNTFRWALALVILLPWGWRVFSKPREILARWQHLALLGLMGVGSYNALQYLALQTSTPLNVTLIAASTPVWMLGIGALAYGVHPGRAQLAGAAMSLAGVALVIARGQVDALLAVRFAAGDLYMLAAVILWAVYSWMLARPPASMRDENKPDWSRAEMLMVQVAIGLLWTSAAAGVEAAIEPTGVSWSWPVLAAIAYVAIGPSLIAYWCWGVGVATVGPAIAAFFANLTPVFAGLMSAALLGDAPQWYHAAAFVLIAAGIAVSSMARPAKA